MSDLASAQLRAFITELKGVTPEVPRAARRALRGAGEVVAAEARKIAAEHSTSIPPTIRTSFSRGSVSVLAGGKGQTRGLGRAMFTASYGTPAADRAASSLERARSGNSLAGLYEYGNRGQRGGGGPFRHPVFGGDAWVDQARYPFLKPAADNKASEVEAEILRVVERYVAILAG